MHRLSHQTEKAAGHDVVLEVWQRRKWMALLVFIAAIAGVVTAVLSLPDLYRATATVLVERQQVSEAFVRPSVTAEIQTRIQTIQQQVMSRARLTNVISRLGLYPEMRDWATPDDLVQRMRRDVKLELKGVDEPGRIATIAFTLSYRGRDPETVAMVANTLVASYVEENTRSREQQASRTATFLKDQLGEVKRELDDLENRASAFKRQHTGELPQQLDANLAALERLNTQLRLNSEYQIRAMERHERIEQQLTDAEDRPAPPGASTSAAAELARLKRELAELRTRSSDQYPDVIRVTAEIAALERPTAPTGSNGHGASPAADPVMRPRQSLAATAGELKSLKAQEALLRKAIATYESRVENAPKRQLELQQVSSDYEATKERYDSLLKRYEDAQLASNLEHGQRLEQFRVLESSHSARPAGGAQPALAAPRGARRVHQPGVRCRRRSGAARHHFPHGR